jgi:hypothetical protein
VTSRRTRVALLWHQAEDQKKARRQRLDGVFRSLTARGAIAEAVVYTDDVAEAVRERLLTFDGVLVWVNPITDRSDRTVLDTVLRDIAQAGVWVSAHPDVVSVLGTKEVLHRTRSLGWGSDVRLYVDPATLRTDLPRRLACGPLVLKRGRGNAGIGVWKLETVTPHRTPTLESVVDVQHAYDGAIETCALGTFLDTFADYFASGGRLVEQPFLPRGAEGMVRCYLSGTTVVGFGEHHPRGFLPSHPARSGKVMYGAAHSTFAGLRSAMESEWVPSMCSLLELHERVLPAIWDADFLRGPKTPSGDDTWVLCEINASCVSPFPDQGGDAIAATALARIGARSA